FISLLQLFICPGLLCCPWPLPRLPRSPRRLRNDTAFGDFRRNQRCNRRRKLGSRRGRYRRCLFGDGTQTSILIVDSTWFGLWLRAARIFREGFAWENLDWPCGIWSLRASLFVRLAFKRRDFWLLAPPI